jgi:hypothetical protein
MGLHLGDRCIELAPVGAADLLQVVDLGWRARPARNFNELIDAFEQAITLRTHMADVASAALCRFRGQCNQLIRLRERSRRVD